MDSYRSEGRVEEMGRTSPVFFFNSPCTYGVVHFWLGRLFCALCLAPDSRSVIFDRGVVHQQRPRWFTSAMLVNSFKLAYAYHFICRRGLSSQALLHPVQVAEEFKIKLLQILSDFVTCNLLSVCPKGLPGTCSVRHKNSHPLNSRGH